MSVVKSARSVNEEMVYFIKNKIDDFIQKSFRNIDSISINVLGLTFKEDCNDVRNSKAQTLIDELKKIGVKQAYMTHLLIWDIISETWGYQPVEWDELEASDFLIVCQSHSFKS